MARTLLALFFFLRLFPTVSRNAIFFLFSPITRRVRVVAPKGTHPNLFHSLFPCASALRPIENKSGDFSPNTRGNTSAEPLEENGLPRVEKGKRTDDRSPNDTSQMTRERRRWTGRVSMRPAPGRELFLPAGGANLCPRWNVEEGMRKDKIEEEEEEEREKRPAPPTL
ncbi:hypothetical protein B0T11DRAFT_77425 [Plectosphaerella cucumerina]|uniref:Secreted protein n=1 Tax=Plectosphaerella cucumerina TaxID=40658 RepID=A0A8K0TFX2_9PEZI|nr:hypothetical protein B0T11DRAFT_77425 [Plectosphaerella cucumerina]